ncbi:MAG: 2OG-Fe(II) oxygenase [Xanthomonadales bacterium]|jgi:SM-20-related protein|nr:2OG-Fe(II) oxygenase [Xanthomonadales bacterium]
MIGAAEFAALAGPGWCVRPGWLSLIEVRALRALSLPLRPAGVGRAHARVEARTIRGDAIAWLDRDQPAAAALLDRFEALRQVLNETFFLGLKRIEAHLACYPPGAGYARHLDRFRDDDARVISAVLYLNEGWDPVDGGQLRLYPQDSDPLDVQPEAGTLVLFRSADLPHEVLPATRERWSVAGWFRRD